MGELGQRMTQGELQTWVAYVEENGPLNPMLRMESMLARIASPFFKNSKPKDWMIWPKIPEPELTPQEMAHVLLAKMKGLAAQTKESRKH